MQLHQLAARGGFALAHELGDEAFGGGKVHVAQLHGQQAAGGVVDRGDAAEVRRLKAELKRVTEERDILKKAAAYFARG